LKRSRTPEHPQPGYERESRSDVKPSISSRVQLDVFHRVGRVPSTQHVMPLKHLVKNDTVKQGGKPDAQHYPRGRDTVLRMIVLSIDHIAAIRTIRRFG
jgi:hypothetical protein